MNYTKTIDLNELLSIDAGESRFTNAWTEKFLHNWREKENGIDKEVIVVKEKKKEFLVYDIDFDDNEQALETLTEKYSFPQPQKKEFIVLGEYSSSPIRKICYYEEFYNSSEEIKTIVRIHERMHAFHHMPNSDEEWLEFQNASIVYKEFLAQIFTYRCVHKTYLKEHFELLCKKQPTVYQTWQLAKTLTTKEVFNIYLNIKNNARSGIVLLDEFARIYDLHRIDLSLTGAINDLW